MSDGKEVSFADIGCVKCGRKGLDRFGRDDPSFIDSVWVCTPGVCGWEANDYELEEMKWVMVLEAGMMEWWIPASCPKCGRIFGDGLPGWELERDDRADDRHIIWKCKCGASDEPLCDFSHWLDFRGGRQMYDAEGYM